MSLNRDDILAADDLPMKEVSVPEWGGSVFVRSMNGLERDQFETSLLGGKNGDSNLLNIRARLASLTICDADGKRLFSDADVKALGKKSAKGLDRVFTIAQQLNGLRDEDVEELAGN